MAELHQLQVSAADRRQIEGVDPAFIQDGLFKARAKTIEVLEAIRSDLREGQSEPEARALAQAIFADFGAIKHWHQPYIRFGAGTVRSFHDPLSDARLRPDDIYHLDLGPVWPGEALGMDAGLDYEGDYGDAFVFGRNDEAQRMIDALHVAFHQTKSAWLARRLTGEAIYVFFKESVETAGYIFVDNVDGHRVGDFPHHKYTRERLSKIAFVPTSSLWILEAMIRHPTLPMGAFFEDLMA